MTTMYVIALVDMSNEENFNAPITAIITADNDEKCQDYFMEHYGPNDYCTAFTRGESYETPETQYHNI